MLFVVLTAAALLVSSAFAGVKVWPRGGPDGAYQAIAGVPGPCIEPEIVNVAALPDAKARQIPEPDVEGGGS